MQRRTRTLGTVVGVAVGSMVLGFVVGGQVQSPQEAAAEAQPPEAGPVTVPVERRALASEVVTRGDAVFAGAVEVTVQTGGLDTPAVVTGQVPAVGDTIEEGTAILEVVGRPVIALAGELPTYRTLHPGLTGPDIRQLEQALVRLGHDSGDAEDATYDGATAAAVDALYQAAGYVPPTVPDTTAQELEAARAAVDAAEDARRGAQQALDAARGGVPASQRLAAEAQVASAKRALEQARADRDARAAAVDAAEDEQDRAEAEAELRAAEAAVADAQAQVEIATASLAELVAPPDTSAQQAALADADRALAEARTDLAELQAAAGTPAPAAEIVFVPTLPRRVDDVAVTRGTLVDGPVMTASGADLVVAATLTPADGALLAEGMEATLDGPGTAFAGEVTELVEQDTGDWRATITPTDLPPEAVAELRGSNLQVTVPVRSTDGEVLVVPLAALTAGPDGSSRVEVRPEDAAPDAEGTLVEVEVGLSADGHAEVRPIDGELAPGDLVVVGK